MLLVQLEHFWPDWVSQAYSSFCSHTWTWGFAPQRFQRDCLQRAELSCTNCKTTQILSSYLRHALMCLKMFRRRLVWSFSEPLIQESFSWRNSAEEYSWGKAGGRSWRTTLKWAGQHMLYLKSLRLRVTWSERNELSVFVEWNRHLVRHACNPSYLGSGGRRITVWGWPWANLRPYQKNN
jgi:hypothetical protein